MSQRQVMSIYYRGSKIVKLTRALYPNNAVVNAVMHMTTNDYSATHVEVFNQQEGQLYAVLRNSLKEGKLHMTVDFKAAVIGRAS